TVIGWGNNSLGQTTPPFGLSNVVAIAAGISHSLALQSDGTVIAWGANYYGERIPPAGLTNVIAIAAGRDRSLAVRSDGTVVGWGQNSFNQTIPPPGISNVVAIAAGDDHTVALEQYPISGVPPVILRQPSDSVTPTGQTVIFNAYATGSSPLRFQWFL